MRDSTRRKPRIPGRGTAGQSLPERNDAAASGDEIPGRGPGGGGGGVRLRPAGMACLAPVPWASGGVDHDQGIGKAGSPMLVREHEGGFTRHWIEDGNAMTYPTTPSRGTLPRCTRLAD